MTIYSDDEDNMIERRDLYTPMEVARLFRVDPKTVARWDKSGRFESLGITVVRTIGEHRRFYRKEIDALFDKLNPAPSGEDHKLPKSPAGGPNPRNNRPTTPKQEREPKDDDNNQS